LILTACRQFEPVRHLLNIALLTMKACLSFILLFLTTGLLANDSLLITRLLQRIDELQPKQNAVFPKGSIPSHRLYALNKHTYKADINPFFTGLVAFTLRDIRTELSASQRQQADTIIEHTLPSFLKFRNRKDGRDTYNFWPTDTPQIFPNAGMLNWFDKSQALPDDMDDTVIILMAQRKSDSVARQIHALMQAFANNSEKKIRNTFPEYQNLGAYSTWFGKKMPVDFDVCVLSNILYFVQFYNLEWTAADSASLYLVEHVIKNKRHLSAPAYVSPHYARTPLLLYHFSRLMALKPIPALEKLKPQLIEETQQALSSADSFMDEVLLSTALLRWGATPPIPAPRKANSLAELVEDDHFSFFIANMASMLSDGMKRWVGASGVGKFYYHCPAYNNLLLLENLALRKRKGIS
jgi:hypothetical protein